MMVAAEDFYDIEDHHYLYRKGDEYPRKGYSPSPERVKMLAGSENRMGRPLICDESKKTRTRKKKGE